MQLSKDTSRKELHRWRKEFKKLSSRGRPKCVRPQTSTSRGDPEVCGRRAVPYGNSSLVGTRELTLLLLPLQLADRSFHSSHDRCVPHLPINLLSYSLTPLSKSPDTNLMVLRTDPWASQRLM